MVFILWSKAHYSRNVKIFRFPEGPNGLLDGQKLDVSGKKTFLKPIIGLLKANVPVRFLYGDPNALQIQPPYRRRQIRGLGISFPRGRDISSPPGDSQGKKFLFAGYEAFGLRGVTGKKSPHSDYD